MIDKKGDKTLNLKITMRYIQEKNLEKFLQKSVK